MTGISQKAREWLLQYDWPGNVRELENAIERAVVLGASNMILPEDLPEAVLESAVAPSSSGAPNNYHETALEAKRSMIHDARSNSPAECIRKPPSCSTFTLTICIPAAAVATPREPCDARAVSLPEPAASQAVFA